MVSLPSELIAIAALTPFRMILYYPVSALVTLFANILQNPQDARARSDIRLMNQVVNFLSLLTGDEETGGVKRMLGVCSEFERISRVVLDRADKESQSRRKRKPANDDEGPLPLQVLERRPLPRTPEPNTAVITPKSPFTPTYSGDMATSSFNPSLTGSSLSNFPSPQNSSNDIPPMPDYMAGPGDFPNMMTPIPDFSDMQQYNDPLNMSSFQQPFVPQDLWQMPMTLEWDWADISANNGYPPLEGQQANGHSPSNMMNGPT